MSRGAETDLLASILKAEAATAMPLSKQREFNRFIDKLQPAQRVLPLLARRADKAPLSGRELRGAIARDAGRGGEGEDCMSIWPLDEADTVANHEGE